ncbi:hypothetical protein Tco_0595915 [Tanacetum coccineum]
MKARLLLTWSRILKPCNSKLLLMSKPCYYLMMKWFRKVIMKKFLQLERRYEDISPTDEEAYSLPPNKEQPKPSHAQESDSDSSSPELKKYDNILPLTKRQLVKYLRKVSQVLFNRITKYQWEKHKEAAVSYADLRPSIEGYYEENVDHVYQTNNLVKATMNYLDKNSTKRADLLKALNGITEILKAIQEAVKEDPVLNNKVLEATKAYTANSNNTLNSYPKPRLLISLVLNLSSLKSVWYDIWDIQCPLINHLSPRDISREGYNLQSRVADLFSNEGWMWPQDWLMKASNLNMIQAPNLDHPIVDFKEGLGKDWSPRQKFHLRVVLFFPTPRLTKIKHTQALMQADLSSIKTDTSKIKSMMTEIYQAFKVQSSTPSSSMPQTTLAITEGPSHVRGRMSDRLTLKPPFYTKEEHVAMDDDTERSPSMTKLISQPESSQAPKRTDKGKKIATDDVESLVKLVPASKVVREDPDEPIRRKRTKSRRLEITKTEVIKIVQEEAEKIKIDPKKIISAKAGEKFKKAQDAELQVLKREHSQKVKRPMELKPNPITDVKIHPNSKPAVLTVLKNNDKRNFQVHSHSSSLILEYKRLKKIPEELGIQSALPAPIPEQAPSQSSRRKRKHMEWNLKSKCLGWSCNKSLHKGVLFVKNIVIEEPDYGIFFTGVFGDQAFQR